MTTTHTVRGWLATQDQHKVEEALAKVPADYLTDSPDPYYRLFMRLVDAKMIRYVGIGHRDVEDYLTYDAYEGGETPSELARNILESSDTFGMLFGGEDE